MHLKQQRRQNVGIKARKIKMNRPKSPSLSSAISKIPNVQKCRYTSRFLSDLLLVLLNLLLPILLVVLHLIFLCPFIA